MKIFIAIILMFFMVGVAYADKFIVPFSCYPKEVQKAFAESGRKLDLSGNDRTKESWGFIVNEGSQFVIWSYKPFNKEDFKDMKEIIWTSGGVEHGQD